jgi:hypothetical protein
VNRLSKKKRNIEIIEYLCEVIGKWATDNPIYHSFSDAAIKFNLSEHQIARIKKDFIGLDKDGIRKIDNYTFIK